MSSYFVNSTFPVSLPGGQDSLLGQIPLYSSGYTDPLRHYSNAATYGAANMQEKVYPASYYQQTGAAAAAIYGRAGGGAPCDYNPVGTFYKDAEGSCAFSSREDQPLFVTQEHQQRKAECPEQAVSMSSSIDDKSSTLIYPWMQRMNACSAGEYSRPLEEATCQVWKAFQIIASSTARGDRAEREVCVFGDCTRRFVRLRGFWLLLHHQHNTGTGCILARTHTHIHYIARTHTHELSGPTPPELQPKSSQLASHGPFLDFLTRLLAKKLNLTSQTRTKKYEFHCKLKEKTSLPLTARAQCVL